MRCPGLLKSRLAGEPSLMSSAPFGTRRGLMMMFLITTEKKTVFCKKISKITSRPYNPKLNVPSLVQCPLLKSWLFLHRSCIFMPTNTQHPINNAATCRVRTMDKKTHKTITDVIALTSIMYSARVCVPVL